MKLIRYAYPAPTDLERVLGTLFPTSTRFGQAFDAFAGANDSGTPAADVYEDANSYYVTVELPGARKEDIHVAVEDAVLTVSATRVEKNTEGEARTEYRRSLAVPESLDPAKVTAAYENGVLTVTLPKLEARKPRTITIQ